jgi:hypothetical protein
MLAYRFTDDMLTELAVDGLLTAHQEHVVGRPSIRAPSSPCCRLPRRAGRQLRNEKSRLLLG